LTGERRSKHTGDVRHNIGVNSSKEKVSALEDVSPDKERHSGDMCRRGAKEEKTRRKKNRHLFSRSERPTKAERKQQREMGGRKEKKTWD